MINLKSFEPFISEKAMDLHYNYHYAGYKVKTQELCNLENIYDLENANILDIIRHSYIKNTTDLFNNSSQVFNHEMFFNSLNPLKAIKQTHKEYIIKHFGSYENFAQEFITKGLKQFASGWIWLLEDNDKVYIITTSNSFIPLELLFGIAKLITVCDLWEHAYYVDYYNKRKDFLTNFVNHLIHLHI